MFPSFDPRFKLSHESCKLLRQSTRGPAVFSYPLHDRSPSHESRLALTRFRGTLHPSLSHLISFATVLAPSVSFKADIAVAIILTSSCLSLIPAFYLPMSPILSRSRPCTHHTHTHTHTHTLSLSLSLCFPLSLLAPSLSLSGLQPALELCPRTQPYSINVLSTLPEKGIGQICSTRLTQKRVSCGAAWLNPYQHEPKTMNKLLHNL